MQRAMAFVFLVCACGGGRGDDDDDDLPIPEATLAGQVGAEGWELAGGYTNAFLSEGEAEFFAELYAEQLEPCGFETPTRPHLIASIPKEPGEYSLSLSLNATFVIEGADGPENLVATDGRIVVDEVTESSVRGGMSVSYDDDNEVEGQFEVAVCADE
ncbi:MAG: hypothetical protein HYY06_04210 [Deltaproteobacteria bacterium]|nr:hypothetical protein [Deltaproteobacteria bacterium]